MRLTLLPLLVLAACQPVSDGRPQLEQNSVITRVGALEDKRLDEASGFAASRYSDNVLWAINDDGKPWLFALDATGTALGRVLIDDATNTDWEDLASYEFDSEAWLIVADIGDNEARRDHVTLYAVREPRPGSEGPIDIGWQLDFTYPEGPRDAEALMVDADNNRLLVLSKRDIPARLYELPLGPKIDDVHQARFLGEIDSLPQPTVGDIRNAPISDVWGWQPSAMDLAADGSGALILTYDAVYYYKRAANEDWMTTLMGSPMRLSLGRIAEAESLAFSADSRAAYMTIEQKHAPLYRVDLTGVRPQ